MSKIFFDVGISMDGYMAGENRGPQNPLGDNGTHIHHWMYNQKAFLKSFGINRGEDGEENKLLDHTSSRAGAYIMGKRMFEEGEANWPEDLYKTTVFVLTSEKREPWIQQGSTVFHFTNEDLQLVIQKAKKAAGGKDVRIQGGADTIRQFLNAGLIDEFNLHTAPVVLGSGIRLFDHIHRDRITLEIGNVFHSGQAVHTQYKVYNKM
ncbi:MAG: dihydrofolate reductase family protein [Chitinophagaceae bacterium]|nr:dihydrofolate reductase family protein [Chitinophagaceae bacterium]